MSLKRPQEISSTTSCKLLLNVADLCESDSQVQHVNTLPVCTDVPPETQKPSNSMKMLQFQPLPGWQGLLLKTFDGLTRGAATMDVKSGGY